jgi:hypothetical protein
MPRVKLNKIISFSRVAKLYSAVYKEYTYDNSHFQKIDELDYITVSTR